MINSSLSVKGRIREISINKECSKHAKMRITIVPDDIKDLNDMLSFVTVGQNVEADIDSTLVMCGKVKKVTGRTTYSGAAVTVLVVSDSIESDIAKTSRIFQSPEKQYKAIAKKISNKSEFEIKKEDFSCRTEETVVVQINETDFEFANRIAAENNTKLFVCANEKGKNRIIIADNLSVNKTLKNENIISVQMDFSEYLEILEIEYRDYIELGTKVKIDNMEYTVVSLNAVYKDGVNKYFYKLEKKLKKSEEDENPVSVISLGKARVTDNKDPENLGRIQVEFLELEDSINDKKIWIQYINTLTANDGGVFYIPDKNEFVEVILQNGKCFAYGCVREKAVSEKINNTDNKSLMLYDKTLVFEEKKITLESGAYTAQISDDELYIKNNDYNFVMNKDGVVIGSDKNIITVKNNQVDISVNNKCKIEVTEKNIKSVAGSGKIELGSGTLDINASSKVEISTMKMNVK